MTALTSRMMGRGPTGSSSSSGPIENAWSKRVVLEVKIVDQTGSGTRASRRPSRAATRPRAITTSGTGSAKSRSSKRSA